MKYLLTLFIALEVMAFSLKAQNVIWVARVKADNQAATEDERLQKLQPRLKCVFGFSQYHLVGEAQAPMTQKYAQWILPNRDYYLKLEPLPNKPTEPESVQFEMYRAKKILVQGQFRSTDQAPIFINGPDYNDGRLIFILQVMHPPAAH